MTLDEIEEMLAGFLADVRTMQEKVGEDSKFSQAMTSVIQAGLNVMVYGCTVVEHMELDDYDLAIKVVADLRETLMFLDRTVAKLDYACTECLRLHNAGRN